MLWCQVCSVGARSVGGDLTGRGSCVQLQQQQRYQHLPTALLPPTLPCACSYLAFLPASSSNNLSGIRAMRALRPLRTLNAIPGLRRLVQTLLQSIPLLLDVLALLAWIFAVFGIVALQIFMGRLRGRCMAWLPPAEEAAGGSGLLSAGVGSGLANNSSGNGSGLILNSSAAGIIGGDPMFPPPAAAPAVAAAAGRLHLHLRRLHKGGGSSGGGGPTWDGPVGNGSSIDREGLVWGVVPGLEDQPCALSAAGMFKCPDGGCAGRLGGVECMGWVGGGTTHACTGAQTELRGVGVGGSAVGVMARFRRRVGPCTWAWRAGPPMCSLACTQRMLPIPAPNCTCSGPSHRTSPSCCLSCPRMHARRFHVRAHQEQPQLRLHLVRQLWGNCPVHLPGGWLRCSRGL